jgi:predicted metal-dependent hydrolase
MKEIEKFRSGIALFNAGRFFEAHEAWEEIWLKESGPEKTYLQGLIQLAAAFHHGQRANPRGAKSLLAAALAKLDRCPDQHWGVAIATLRDEGKIWAEGLQAQGFPKIQVAQKGDRKKKRGG